uniref:Uncharacterized protein n=1 Tax=Chenopodium quinoa TaxID=63459 RepID=A0A803M8F2_CHEQI
MNEVCPLCGSSTQPLATCPRRIQSDLHLIVERLHSSSLNSPVAKLSENPFPHDDRGKWIKVYFQPNIIVPRNKPTIGKPRSPIVNPTSLVDNNPYVILYANESIGDILGGNPSLPPKPHEKIPIDDSQSKQDDQGSSFLDSDRMMIFFQLLRENKRMLDKSIREIERERAGLQTQEKKLIAEIKKSAKQGQMGAVRIMAKDLIRTRHQVEKFYKLKSQLQGTLKSTQAMGEAMKGVTKAMGQMNRQMNLPSLQKIMQEFERQNERMELTSEVMGDAIDDALEGDEEEDETDELVNQVLDEIGIDVNQELVNAPSGAVAAPAAKGKVAQAEATATGNDDGGIDDDLQARLDNLRRM